jgi:hypothetical protein
MGARLRDTVVDRCVVVAGRFSVEGAPEARYAGVRMLQRLARAVGDRQVARLLADSRLLASALEKEVPPDAFDVEAAAAGGGISVDADGGTSSSGGGGGGDGDGGGGIGSGGGGGGGIGAGAAPSGRSLSALRGRSRALSVDSTAARRRGASSARAAVEGASGRSAATADATAESASMSATAAADADEARPPSAAGAAGDAAVARCASSDWRERVAGLAGLLEWARDPAILTSSQAVRLADSLARLLADPHLKVQGAAAATAGALVHALRGENLDKAAVILVPGLGACLASTQRPCADAAASTLDALLAAADAGTMLLPMVALLRTSTGRVRAVAAAKLAALLPLAHARRPQSLLRIVLGALVPLLAEGAAGKAQVASLARALADTCGAEAIVAAAAPGLDEEGLARLKALLQ